MTETSTRATGVAAARPKLAIARLRDFALVPAIIVLLVVGALVAPAFLSTGNLINVLQQQTELGLLVLAEALILVSGKIDLSLESTVGFAPALAIALIIPKASHGLGLGLPEWTGIPVCLLIGALVGLFNGFLILKLRLSGFVVTLGVLIVVRGLQLGFTTGQNLFDLPLSFTYLGTAEWLGLPASVWIFAAAFAVGIVALGYFRQGRSLYAIGGNSDAARAAGIRTDRVIWTVLVIGGLLAALAGLLMAGRLGSVAASQGQNMIFTVFAAAVIGGVSLNGGKGTLFGALCGVLVLGLVQNILTLAHVSSYWYQAINGAIILVALMLSRITSGKAQD
ncbi:ABC transporter permease [Solihabitans fulvus]|uniref:ABC transporter permease n=1 Tax=Solihabitans fulvus TaxID=1892852 RepID=A0A5B2XGC2_9PSEU|nr:ABC transporter permease [Solihabitans fulvus]KAA2262393.1 ABC transporter permease [Solihabitans fulvus]